MSRLSKMLADHVAVFHRADFSLAEMAASGDKISH
jgi:hypothetical protein